MKCPRCHQASWQALELCNSPAEISLPSIYAGKPSDLPVQLATPVKALESPFRSRCSIVPTWLSNSGLFCCAACRSRAR